MLALERSLADDPAELHAQLSQDRLSIEWQATLATCAVDERFIRPQADTACRKRLLEHCKHVQGTDPAAAKGVA
eukprot:11237509-Alexandrium_andersonii.AAC.1